MSYLYEVIVGITFFNGDLSGRFPSAFVFQVKEKPQYPAYYGTINKILLYREMDLESKMSPWKLCDVCQPLQFQTFCSRQLYEIEQGCNPEEQGFENSIFEK